MAPTSISEVFVMFTQKCFNKYEYGDLFLKVSSIYTYGVIQKKSDQIDHEEKVF